MTSKTTALELLGTRDSIFPFAIGLLGTRVPSSEGAT